MVDAVDGASILGFRSKVFVLSPENVSSHLGLPWWLSRWRIRLQCRRPGFDPWVGKIPWRRERLPTPVFWPGEFHGQYSPRGHKESDTTEQLSLHVGWNAYYWLLGLTNSPCHYGASQLVLMVKNMQKTQKIQVQSLGQENPLEWEMATCSNMLAWKTPWTEDPGGLQSTQPQRVRCVSTAKHAHTPHTPLYLISSDHLNTTAGPPGSLVWVFAVLPQLVSHHSSHISSPIHSLTHYRQSGLF